MVSANRKGVRRRRTWYRRHLRMRRALIAVFVGALLAGAAWQNAASYFSLSSVRSSRGLPTSFWARSDIHKDLAFAAARSFKRRNFVARIPGVYPYSVVPGGVKDPDALRDAALRDAVVRRHYSHFDYSRAHLVRATEAREVYLSYRIRDTVFWTRRRIRLQVGELLLTDGKITARARCGNQISETAKPEVSNEEPAEDVLDQPVVAVESAPSMPIRPVLEPPDLPVGEPLPPKLFAGGFFFPYLPNGVTFYPERSKHCPAGEEYIDGHCRTHKKPVVPEPSTMALIGCGLVLIMWRYRRTAHLAP